MIKSCYGRFWLWAARIVLGEGKHRNSKQTASKEKPGFIESLSALIVDKRKAFYLIYIGLTILCVFSRSWVDVNNELTSYLPVDTETRQGLTVMEAEFVTFGTNRIMVDNSPSAQTKELAERIAAVPGIRSVDFDGGDSHYRNGAALLSVTYDGTDTDQVSLDALKRVKAALSGFDVYVTGSTGMSDSASLAGEMVTVMAVAVVLQLALAIDYAIVIVNRYTELKKTMDRRDAAVEALGEAFPTIVTSGNQLLYRF